jgi:hypothetical protein
LQGAFILRRCFEKTAVGIEIGVVGEGEPLALYRLNSSYLLDGNLVMFAAVVANLAFIASPWGIFPGYAIAVQSGSTEVAE